MESVTVITVTYGNRWKYLNDILISISSLTNVETIIVVDNCSSYNVADSCGKISSKINVITLDENKGSAIGYSIGIQEAIKYNYEGFIWLLDDDNLPLENALDSLIYRYKEIYESCGNKAVGLTSLRKKRNDHLKVAAGQNPNSIFPAKNSFLGFHYKNILQRFFKKYIFTSQAHINTTKQPYIKIPVAPYGGFFFHKSTVNLIGFPNSDFYLYADDHQYTYRLNSLGGIYLVPESIVDDIDQSWFVVNNTNYYKSLILNDSSFRIYYSVRNRIYFEQTDLVENKREYMTNRSLLLILLRLISILYKRRTRYRFIRNAIKDGENGSLGKNTNLSS